MKFQSGDIISEDCIPGQYTYYVVRIMPEFESYQLSDEYGIEFYISKWVDGNFKLLTTIFRESI